MATTRTPRRFHRLLLKIIVRVDAQNRSFRTHLEDLSVAGARVAGTVGIPAGRKVVLHFMLPGVETAFALKGTVRWVDPTSFGVQFAPIAGEDLQNLAAFCVRHRPKAANE